jgi:hypothetical protein
VAQRLRSDQKLGVQLIPDEVAMEVDDDADVKLAISYLASALECRHIAGCRTRMSSVLGESSDIESNHAVG